MNSKRRGGNQKSDKFQDKSPNRENERGEVSSRGGMQTAPARPQTSIVKEEIKEESSGGWGSIDLFGQQQQPAKSTKQQTLVPKKEEIIKPVTIIEETKGSDIAQPS